MEFLIWLGITIAGTLAIGFPLLLLGGYLSYFDPAEDLRKLLARIKKRSWE